MTTMLNRIMLHKRQTTQLQTIKMTTMTIMMIRHNCQLAGAFLTTGRRSCFIMESKLEKVTNDGKQ